ncbi:MAG: 16S rRNA (cytosine(967)-C(5))-methyltransferase RsmB [Clostridia bacterium]|jgi:16S rRNA (cytosine967-C5)-methyltransferase|nr:16S rRNA (cytosine(967)-C(5))-methyltransferase RsmB [Clostridia bacterium]
MNSRKLALQILGEILEGKYSNIALREALKHSELDQRDRGFVTEIVNGTVRNMIKIDYIISQFTKGKRVKREVKNILRISIYQILFMDKVPVSAAVNEAVKIVNKSKYKALKGFVNGVLRNVDRERETIKYPNKNKKEYLSVYYSVPMWLVDMLYSQYDNAEEIIKNLNNTPKLTIRLNSLKGDLKSVAEIVAKDLEIEDCGEIDECKIVLKGKNILSLDSFNEGYFTVQGQSSMMVSNILEPKSGEKIIDMCSAPGGKTTHIAEMMGNNGEIRAFDVHEHKIKLIEDTTKRLGIDIIKAGVKDGTIFDGNLESYADKILLDVPCSGIGIISKRPDIKLKDGNFDELVEIQKKIIENGIKYLKEDGILVYSTCTLNKKENDENVKWMIDKFGLELVPFEGSNEGYMTIIPSKENTDGFFIAKLRKI